MATQKKVFIEKKNKYLAVLKDGIVTVRIDSHTAQGNSRICGVYNIEEHRWFNDGGRKVLPCNIKNQVEHAFKPLDLET